MKEIAQLKEKEERKKLESEVRSPYFGPEIEDDYIKFFVV